MQNLKGIPVSPGIAIGEAMIVDQQGFHVSRRFVAASLAAKECTRFEQAVDSVAATMEKNRLKVEQQIGPKYGAIFSAHLEMLRDQQLSAEIVQLIREKSHSAEYASSRVLRRYAKVFESLDDAYISQRADDIYDIEKHILRELIGGRRQELSGLSSPVIVLAHDLTPSETALLDPQFVKGFVTESGGLGGHTAIVAEALGIPAVVGAGRFLTDVAGGDLTVIDGDSGRVIIQPDEETMLRFQRESEQQRKHQAQLAVLRDLPAETTCGVSIKLGANIEFPREVDACVEHGANSIGLYRTEFLYLNCATDPSEDEQFEAYAQVVRAFPDRPVVFRTLDLGADKMRQLPVHEEERNPFLGLRSIRLSLQNPETFLVQLRAILRASALGKAWVMFPLISTLSELRKARQILGQAMDQLDEEGTAFDRDIAIGMMVESPAAVVMLDRFLPLVDFLSIGTNDLIQYALAVDRSNKDVADLYRAADPAVLRMILTVVQQATAAGISVNLCGQMSASSIYVMLLLGLGLRALSVPPGAIPEIKKLCRSVSIEECETVARNVLEMDSAPEIEQYLLQQLKLIAPRLTMNE